MTNQLLIIPRQERGFTLIEVLVATVILIISITVVSMIYRGAYIGSEKANNHIMIKTALPAILATVRSEIRQRSNSNDTQLEGRNKVWDTQYYWTAQLKEFKSPPAHMDVDAGGFVTPDKKYKLWEVALTLTMKQTTKSYQFKELSWNNE
ncbi:PulJ/GspJ family protein [Thalassotalea piscium]